MASRLGRCLTRAVGCGAALRAFLARGGCEGGRDTGVEDAWGRAGAVHVLGAATRPAEVDDGRKPCEVCLERVDVVETAFPDTGATSGLGAPCVPTGGAGSGPGPPPASALPPPPSPRRPAATTATNKRARGEHPEPAPHCRRHRAGKVTNVPPSPWTLSEVVLADLRALVNAARYPDSDASTPVRPRPEPGCPEPESQERQIRQSEELSDLKHESGVAASLGSRHRRGSGCARDLGREWNEASAAISLRDPQ